MQQLMVGCNDGVRSNWLHLVETTPKRLRIKNDPYSPSAALHFKAHAPHHHEEQ